MLDHVFSPITINNMTLKNRMVVTPMVTQYCNPDGTATERYIAYHEEKAKGGFGLIITEDYAVAPNGRGFNRTAGLWNDEQIKSHAELPKRVHKHGAKILAQIYHCGRQTSSEAIPGLTARATSRVKSPFADILPEPLTTDEVSQIVQMYVDTAVRAQTCGFDGIQIHAGHGYLITEFLSPYSNKRLDKYGGNFWNRTRFMRDIISGIREACGKDFVIDIRLSGDEFVDGGLTIEDAKAIAIMCESSGVDMIHISTGNHLSFDYNVPGGLRPHGFMTSYARDVKRVVNVPVTVVARINDPFLADEIVASGDADLIGMGRASIVDPGMPNKAKAGHFEDIRHCFGCNKGCIGSIMDMDPATCVINPEVGREYEGPIVQSDTPKKIVIVGAGPGGLEAAIYAAKRGHKVVVFEKKDHNGGQFFSAAVPPGKGEITDFLIWQTVQCDKLGVEIRYNTEATFERIEEEKPDHVILASGATNRHLDLPGFQGDERVVDPEDVLEGKIIPGHRCVVIGGALVGTETAAFLGQELCDVTVVEMRSDHSLDAVWPIFVDMHRLLDHLGVKALVHTTAKALKEEGVVVEDHKGSEKILPADTIVMAIGRKPYNPLEAGLKERGFEVSVIGDAAGSHDTLDAVRDAFELCREL
ncbi:MAG: FAD-dependent oxidoreductase [Peptoniphilus sp.]|nr:FAD-dependent oxidoreductase [Peptoniphilus sp.]MDD7363521.1 FAD-dependent oxidoreductase [Bacillota bacterium]MDY6044776.1 FAD-dependent oxidoreductase [Peptoniphilus sp.]